MIPSRPGSFLVGSVLALLGLWVCACDSGSPTAPDPGDIRAELSAQVETEHIVFHLAPGDRVDGVRQEAHYRWAAGRLGIALPGKLEYFKYRDRGHMQQLTGRAANGWADPASLAVHSVFPFHAHEAAHVYTSLVGRPSDFFNEGIAVALTTDPLAGDYEPTYDGVTPVHRWARDQLRAGGLLPLHEVVTTDGFRAVDEWTGYQEAGSFVLHLEQSYGLDLVLAYFGGARRDDSLERIRSDFAAVFGFSLEEAERRWREFLGG